MGTDIPTTSRGAAADTVRDAPGVREQDDGIRVLHVDTGPLRAAFLPDVGGRLISLEHDGREVLWRNPEYIDERFAAVRPRTAWPVPDGTMGSWANVGGAKTWPAPQGWSSDEEWPGPPDPVLDGGTWTVQVESGGASTRLTFTSPNDIVTGLQVTRSFTFTTGACAFHQHATFRATGPHPVRWAIWEVVQVATDVDRGARHGGDHAVGTFIGVAPPATVIDLLPEGSAPTAGLGAPGVLHIPPHAAVGKLGFPTATGSIRHLWNDGTELHLDWPIRHDAPYPDSGSRAELWTQGPTDAPIPALGGLHPTAHLIELEMLGPLTLLRPGETTSLTIDWRIT